MDMYKLSLSDIKDIEMLINLTNSISDYYNQIKLLEQDNKRDTVEYTIVFKHLLNFISIEREMYKRISPKEKYLSYYLYISKNYNVTYKNNIIDTILNDKNLPLIRIINTLVSFIETTPDTMYILDDKKIIDDLDTVDKVKYLSCLNKENIDILPTIKNDILNIYLSYLASETSSTLNEDIKYFLINAKYIVSLTNKNVEEYLFKNNFSPRVDEIYIMHIFKGEIYNLSEITELLKYSYIVTFILPNIEKFLTFDNISLLTTTLNMEAILRLNLFKASLHTLEEEDIKNIASSYKTLETKMQNNHYSKVYKMLMDVFNNYEIDQERLRILKTRIN